ncbi:HET-domain-containing protein, partial [Eremomyces bilateralis CBS 781.70]
MDDPAVFKLAAQWLSNCTTESLGHDNCNRSTTPGFRPRRLLDIRGETFCLSLDALGTTQEPYCALSYCWGEGPTQLILTTSNEEEFRRNIAFPSLSKTIQDAIYVAKRLRINYIWVDSLCIIQKGDGGQDWIEHSSTMSNIYSNCILNLSA